MVESGTHEKHAFAAADDAGFESFVRLHADGVVRSLTTIALDREMALDASQEAFIRLYLRWNDARRPKDPLAWVYRVGVNRCMDLHRYTARAARLFDRLVTASSARDAQPAWEPELDFAATVRRLSGKQRVVAVLHYQADFSTAEIARILQISEGAVKSHLHRARERLRSLVEEE
jgi:RNA polymerase sigma-70 factor, ECF subfamily